ncbi:MAG: M55 family metallopeptidase [Oscillospiraceae bacterium]|nr:M55 family metallopeptidase [Oscillospiraceae bacterium]
MRLLKLYISADIEGTAGIAHWDETDAVRGGSQYDYFCGQMTREVAAACRGAQSLGNWDVYVKDAHDSARNIIPTELPRGVRLRRDWSGNPLVMVEGLDAEHFDALALTGYHSAAWDAGNPLSHTMITAADEVLINDERASEFMISAYTAGMLGVPVVFLSGDENLCKSAKVFIPGITTVAVSNGIGNGSVAMHPLDAAERIEDGTRRALQGDLSKCQVKMPDRFSVRIRYKEHTRAYRMGWYPGAVRVDEKTIEFESANYDDILRFFLFVL